MSSRVRIYPSTGALWHSIPYLYGTSAAIAPGSDGYLPLMFYDVVVAAGSLVSLIVPQPAQFSYFKAEINCVSCDGGGMVALHVNGVDTVLKLTQIAGNASIVSDLTHVVPVNVGNLISLHVTHAGTSGNMGVGFGQIRMATF